ncbi:MAG: hypothetical protein HY812_14920 [Planctomycetes bacterium]|nr:hypothetical protein [Planctomycetota bacterium]
MTNLQPQPEVRPALRARGARARLAHSLLRGSPAALSQVLALEGCEIDLFLREAMQARSPFAVSFDEFRRQVVCIGAARFLQQAASLGLARRQAGRILDFCPSCLADLYLAMACARHPRQNGAWNFLVLEHAAELHRAARSFHAACADEEVNRFFADIWVRRRDDANLLGTYRGLAPLRAWLLLVFRRRLAARRSPPRAAALPESLPDPAAADPKDQVADSEFREALCRLLLGLLAELPRRDREFIEARLLRNEDGIVTAARFGVSPSYVSRRYRELLDCLRARLAPFLARRGIDPRELA